MNLGIVLSLKKKVIDYIKQFILEATSEVLSKSFIPTPIFFEERTLFSSSKSKSNLLDLSSERVAKNYLAVFSISFFQPVLVLSTVISRGCWNRLWK